MKLPWLLLYDKSPGDVTIITPGDSYVNVNWRFHSEDIMTVSLWRIPEGHHNEVSWWPIAKQRLWWLHSRFSKLQLRDARWLHFNFTWWIARKHQSVSGWIHQMTFGSNNETNKKYDILVHCTDCETSDHLWHHSNVTWTVCAVRVVPVCYSCRLYPFHLTTYK